MIKVRFVGTQFLTRENTRDRALSLADVSR